MNTASDAKTTFINYDASKEKEIEENSKLEIAREVAARCLKGIVKSDKHALNIARGIVNIVEKRLTQRALDKVPVRIGDACPTCGGCDVQCAECLAALCQ